ncbi:hypothetical protein [Maritimibacter alkaliphilus]|uniref:hypothetical protein n=1 Tax=Maritimibacter alkaliphilus TaxID=404236 RepID=UPI001C962A8D|nr:hypothetical protein [Maritimibacter alkaliphilus]MBY6088746.1 hypothetical protein [Maritimibacter alkaliphilus]
MTRFPLSLSSQVRRLSTAICLAATLLLVQPLPGHTREIEFGPGLRSIDFDKVFDRSNATRAKMWDDLYAAGLRGVVLSQGMVSPRAPDHSSRPDGTYLAGPALKQVRETMNRGPGTADDFHVTYVAGYGLGGTGCGPGDDPATLGREAADWEFETALKRLLDAGIPIRRIDVDGPFLRLITNSRKAFSCAVGQARSGYSGRQTATAVHAYMKRLRDRVDTHKTTTASGLSVRMGLLFNLPNWALGGRPALKSAGATGDLIEDVLLPFGRIMAEDRDRRPLSLASTVIDYPYPYVLADPAAFKAKTAALLDALRDLPDTAPTLTFITNTDYGLASSGNDPRQAGYEGTVPCVWRDNWKISGGSLPYLPYENAAGQTMPADCVAQQNDADSRYREESVKFAEMLDSGAWRGRSVAASDIAAYRFTSWHEMPVSSISMMNRVLRFMTYGE